jgi:spore maturation protein CgeB
MNNPRILMIDVAYWDAIKDHYGSKINDVQKDLEFGIGFYLNKAFIKRGWISNHFFANDLSAQLKWLQNHDNKKQLFRLIDKDFEPDLSKPFTKPRKYLHYLVGLHIARIQIQYYRPDIIWFFGPSYIPPAFLKTLPSRKQVLKIAHISSPLPNISWFKNYDLMLSSQNSNVSKWREMNLRAELFKQAVDADSCLESEWEDRKLPLTFIGGVSELHLKRREYLEVISNNFDISLFGPGKSNLPKGSPLFDKWNDPVWGLSLFKLLANSKISINIHGDISSSEAANIRLLEVTGAGSLLLTESQPNLDNYFKGDEVVSYQSLPDLLDKIRFYMENDKLAKEIAKAGQIRTLSEHTFDHRATEMSDILLSTY